LTANQRELGKPLRRSHHGGPRRSSRAQRRRTRAVTQHSQLSYEGAGADGGDRFAIDLDVEDAVEEEEHLTTRLALLDERLAPSKLPPAQPGTAAKGDPVELVLKLVTIPRRVVLNLRPTAERRAPSTDTGSRYDCKGRSESTVEPPALGSPFPRRQTGTAPA
jgi:hypothetical protein